MFAVCRGLQELNVALGGTLNPEIHATPGRLDHARIETIDLPSRYGPAHDVEVSAGGLIGASSGRAASRSTRFTGKGSSVWPLASRSTPSPPDGTIEAVRHKGARFVLAVQWHPEWRAHENPISAKLFEAFGTALRSRP